MRKPKYFSRDGRPLSAAEALDARDDRVELLAHSRGHERQQLDLRQFAFGLSRSAFGDSAAFRRWAPEDPQLHKAVELLGGARSQQELLAVVVKEEG